MTYDFCDIPICGVSDELNEMFLESNRLYTIKKHLYYLAEYIVLVFNPIMIVLGSIFNVLSVVMFVRPSLWQTTTAYLFTLLALADTLVLYTGALVAWMEMIGVPSFRVYSTYTCRIHHYMYGIIYALPGWILVLITIERIIGVGWPFKASIFCTKKNATKFMMAIIFILSLLYTPVLVGVNQKYDIIFEQDEMHFTTKSDCYMQADMVDAEKYPIIIDIIRWLDPIARIITPSSLVLCGNTILITLVVKVHLRRHNMHVQSDVKNLLFLSVMLIITCLTYLLLHIPHLLLNIIPYKTFFTMFETPNDYICAYTLWYNCALCSGYINCSINFFLYCLSGRTFRNEFKSMCACFHNSRLMKNSNQHHDVTSSTMKMGNS